MGLREYRAKRDFTRTPEPSGEAAKRSNGARDRAEAAKRARSFVVQKHDASHLHYDFRLELEGVLKSWSVPKGPTLDPAVKRLAMQTEDHPLDYADFEGVIPKGQYGGGTVVVWDAGTWIPLDDDPHGAFRAGKLSFELRGEKLRGAFTLVRKGKDDRAWLLMKHDDRAAKKGSDVTASRPESVTTGRTIEEVEVERDRVWHSNRGDVRASGADVPGARPAKKLPSDVRVQRAKAGRKAPEGDGWLHELALDGDRVVARVEAGRVRLVEADGGADVTRALRPIVEAFEGTRLRDAIVDGVVLKDAATFFAFDLLHLEGFDLRRSPLEARKAALEAVLDAAPGDPHLRYARHVVGSGQAYVEKACELGARGVISKKRDATYGAAGSWRVVACAAPAKKKAPKPRKPRKAREAHAERVAVAGVSISHPERVMYPETGVTKVDVARYYETVADAVLPHLRGRPLTLVRCGAGLRTGQLRADCMYMKHGRVWGPPALRRVNIREKTKTGEYLVADQLDAVVGLVQMDILEIHTWNTRVEHVEEPDRVVFDLDPGPEVPWRDVVRAAFEVRDRLRDLHLESWVKTTGGVGLHVVVPLVPAASWDECFAFTRAIAQEMAGDDPKRFTTNVSKAGREDKIYVDYLRNNRGNTSVAAYSTRAKPLATVSTPLAWNELDEKLLPSAFTVSTVPTRLARQRKDPWADYFRAKQKLARSLLRRLHAA